jgi:phosphate transport system substrate-binding protein
MKWNQVNPAWPDAPVKLFGAGADSGTFEYFTEAMVGKAKSSRGDYTASEDDNVLVQGVSRDVNAIGYFGYAYYAENTAKLKALPIVNPKTGRCCRRTVCSQAVDQRHLRSRCHARSSSMSRPSLLRSRK